MHLNVSSNLGSNFHLGQRQTISTVPRKPDAQTLARRIANYVDLADKDGEVHKALEARMGLSATDLDAKLNGDPSQIRLSDLEAIAEILGVEPVALLV